MLGCLLQDDEARKGHKVSFIIIIIIILLFFNLQVNSIQKKIPSSQSLHRAQIWIVLSMESQIQRRPPSEQLKFIKI